jgi:hypothetical protein
VTLGTHGAAHIPYLREITIHQHPPGGWSSRARHASAAAGGLAKRSLVSSQPVITAGRQEATYSAALSPTVAMDKDHLTRFGFDELLLAGVILLMITGVAIGIGLYAMPAEHLEMPELQPVVRVTDEANFPVGSSRLRNWGDRTILIVRPDSLRYFALQGTSPADGCTLRWDSDALRVYSPCSYQVYDLKGDVVAGLSTQALVHYAVSIRDGVIYVSEATR